MGRIVRIAFAAAVAAAAALAVRRLLKPDTGAGRAPPPARSTDRSGANGAVAGSASSSQGAGPTRDQLYREAQRLEIQGRSKMSKQELQEAVETAKTGGPV
jgi:hypothetical protein